MAHALSCLRTHLTARPSGLLASILLGLTANAAPAHAAEAERPIIPAQSIDDLFGGPPPPAPKQQKPDTTTPVPALAVPPGPSEAQPESGSSTLSGFYQN